MIENENIKYDFYGRSFQERCKKSSSMYEPGVNERKNLEVIEEYLQKGLYSSLQTLNAHMAYLMNMINKLSSIQREEISFWGYNPSLTSQLSRIKALSEELQMAKASFLA